VVSWRGAKAEQGDDVALHVDKVSRLRPRQGGIPQVMVALNNEMDEPFAKASDNKKEGA